MEILELTCSKHHFAAVSVNYIRRPLGEGAYYSHMWIYKNDYPITYF